MSLYNMLFGENPFAETLLLILGTHRDKIPRYRDCFLNDEGDIVIHTRTGGGNRDWYDSAESYKRENPDATEDDLKGPFNEHLRALPGFKRDEDDDFDSTYADFIFDVPEAAKPMIATLKELGAVADPKARWADMLEKLRTGDKNDPSIARALEVGEKILTQLNLRDARSI